MKKRVISLILTVALMFGVVSMTAVRASAASSMKASEQLITILKQFEGFIEKPVWDYSQYSVGYGSLCPSEDYERYMENGITEEEADALLRKYVAVAEKAVNRMIDTYGLSLNQNQFDTLIDFCYNCGTGWTTRDGSFRSAVISGATGDTFLDAIASWCKAGDQIVGGLIRRRLAEANMYLNGVYSVTPPSSYCYVLFNGNGGYCGKTIQAFQSSTVITTLPAVSREGYSFAGWFNASKGGQQITQLDSSVSGRTLFARWENENGTPVEEPQEKEVNYQRVVRVSNSLNVRQEANTSSSVVKVLHDGDVITIVAELQMYDFLWGKLSDGGWIALKYTEAYTGEPETPTEPEEPEEPETPEEPEAPEEPETPETPSTSVTISVTGDVVNVRSGAGTGNAVTGQVYRGQTIEIVEVQEAGGAKWGKRSNGGWLCLTYTDYGKTNENNGGNAGGETGGNNGGETGSGATVTVTGSVVNVRSGAGTGNGVISSVYSGQSLTIVEVTDAGGRPWGKLSAGGWICLSYTDYKSSTTGGNEGGETGGNNGGETGSGTTVTVTGSVVNVRSGAGTSNSVSKTVYRGTTLTIVSTASAGGMTWGQLSTGGWIALQYTTYSGGAAEAPSTPTTPSEPTGGAVTGTVNASSLNIRSQAGMSGAVVGGLSNGQTVEILEQMTVDGMTWGRISSGWISMTYVNTQGGSTGGSTGGSGSTYTVTGNVVNVRTGAGLSNSVASTVTRGTKVTIVATASADGMTWGQLSTGGWISMTYVG